jgi:hypothetical protein
MRVLESRSPRVTGGALQCDESVTAGVVRKEVRMRKTKKTVNKAIKADREEA